MKLATLLAPLTLLWLPACVVADDTSADEQDTSTPTQYVNIFDFPSTDQGAWYDLIRKLDGQFAASADAGGITPLTFSCSVTSKAGSVKDCAWTFASATALVDGKAAGIQVSAPTFQCHIYPKTTAKKLIALLEGTADPFNIVLPGTTSIHDSLASCFQNPIGGTPLVISSIIDPTYVDADSYYATAASKAKWDAAKAALELGFDNICGDTFCGSDFGDLQAMKLACAVTKSTGNIKGCAWIFGGSYTVEKSTGALDITSKTFVCPVAPKATLPQWISALTATGTEDAIHRTLPGQTTTAYDALGGCLP